MRKYINLHQNYVGVIAEIWLISTTYFFYQKYLFCMNDPDKKKHTPPQVYKPAATSPNSGCSYNC